MKKNIVFNILVIISLFSVLSCNDNELGSSDEPSTPTNIKNILRNAITEWGISSDELKSSMHGYEQTNPTDSILQFNNPNGTHCISYGLHNGKLCATSIIVKDMSTSINIESLFQEYTYLGELDNGEIYENEGKNTMVAVFPKLDSDSTLYAIGFSPIESNAYQSAESIMITTGNAKINSFSANVEGEISGIDDDVEVGIIYGTNHNISENSGKRMSTSSHGKFSVTINGLIDESTYYYCAYAIINNIYYLGDIKSFQTQPLSYSVDNKTYKMIRVKSESLPEFCMMQTELPPSSDFIIGGTNIGPLNTNLDQAVTTAEAKTFFKKLKEITGLNFRLPTTQEWTYAATGGNTDSKYIYSGGDDINSVAWYKGNSENKVHSVATKNPNSLGFYDMSGNYAEICNNKDDFYYIDGIRCGGSWKDLESDCKITSQVQDPQTGEIHGTTIKEKNAIDARFITIRLVYTRE